MQLIPLIHIAPAVVLMWLFAAVVLRTMAIASGADAASTRHWRQLSHMHSIDGIAFFPTIDARLELELAIREVVDLEAGRRGSSRFARRGDTSPRRRVAGHVT